MTLKVTYVTYLGMPVVAKIDREKALNAWDARSFGDSYGDVARRLGCSRQGLYKIVQARDPLSAPSAPSAPSALTMMRRAVSETVSSIRDGLVDAILRFQEAVHEDVTLARMRFREMIQDPDPRVALAGAQIWDLAIKHGRLNLGLPSEIAPNTGGPSTVINITSQSDKRRVIAPAP